MVASPKAVFLGIVAFGLPFAVTTGWMLGGLPRSMTHLPGGAGGIGRAPISVVSPIASRPGWAPAPVASPTAAAPAASRVTVAPVPTRSTSAPAAAPATTTPALPRPTAEPERSLLPLPSLGPTLVEPTEGTTQPGPTDSPPPDDGQPPAPPD